MNKISNTLLITLISATVLVLNGCAGGTDNMNTGVPVTQSATPALSTAAQLALDQAKIDVTNAIQQRALWTTAQNELDAAEVAAGIADNAAVITHARQASKLAKRGIAQLSLPSTDPFK